MTTESASVRTQILATIKTWPVITALVILGVIVLLAILAPWLSPFDPTAINPASRLRPPSADHWLGTDAMGRDAYSRALYGARISLVVGLGVTICSIAIGIFLGLMAGFFRTADAIIMRLMDGLMAIPGILLAIALVSLIGASLYTVLIAIMVPEIPRVVRLVRSVVLKVSNEPYIEAAISLGTRTPTLLWRHFIPNTIAPLTVQGTYIFAAAVLTEATLSFLGAGLPLDIPSWGNMMAQGRMYFQIKPYLVLFPGFFLAVTLLSVNILGDAFRDALDPRMVKRG